MATNDNFLSNVLPMIKRMFENRQKMIGMTGIPEKRVGPKDRRKNN